MKFNFTEDTEMQSVIKSKKTEIEDLEDLEDDMKQSKFKNKMKKLKNELKNLYLEKAKLDYEKKKEYWERYIVKIENPVLFVEKKYGEFIIRPSKTMKEVYFNARI